MIIPVVPVPTAVYWRVMPLIVAGWLLVAFSVLASLPGGDGQFVLGLVFGTAFQHSLLAAAWAALGPGKLLFRLPMSLVWACLMGAAITLPLAVREKDPHTFVFVLTTAGFWCVGQVPIWLAVALFGLQLRHQGSAVAANDSKQRQFGIGQLMIFTAFVAVLLGIGRLLIAHGWLPKFEQEVVLLLALLLCAQVLISLPLLFGALLKSRVVAACISGTVFGIIVTSFEMSLAEKIIFPSPTGESWILTWINFVGALWVLLFAAVVRFSGYQFGAPEEEPGIQYLEPEKPARAGYRRPESVLYIDDS